MSEYFNNAGHSFIVSEANKDKAIGWLANTWIYDYGREPHKVRAIETGDGRYVLDPDDVPFSADFSNSGPGEEAKELLSLCEDGSYLSVYCDSYMEYAFYWKEDGTVKEGWKSVENPFAPVMDKLDEMALGIFRR